MSRTIPRVLLVVAMISIFAMAQSTVPNLTISIYAPREKNAPLRITGFQYRDGSIGLTIHNQSDKTVTSFAVAALLSAPPGCTSPSPVDKSSQNSILTPQVVLTISPHASATLSTLQNLPFDPPSLVTGAQRAKYAYLHVQAAIGAVHFSDGSVWRLAAENTAGNHVPILNPELAIRDSHACAHLDLSGILNNLEKVSKVGFSTHTKVAENVTEQDGAELSVPHLVLHCSLDNDSAICPWN